MKKYMILFVFLCIGQLIYIASAEESISDIVLDIRTDKNSVLIHDDGSFFLVGDRGDHARTEDQPAYAVFVEPNGTIKWEVFENYNGEGLNYFSGISKGTGSFFTNNIHVSKDSNGESIREFIVTEIDQAGMVTNRILFEQTSWLLPSKDGYIIRTPGKMIEPGAQGTGAYCPILTSYSEEHTLLWETEIDVPFVPIQLNSAEDGFYAYGSMVSFDDSVEVYKGALVKLNNDGDVLWIEQTINDCSQYIDCAILSNENIIVIGNSGTYGPDRTAIATCYTPDGSIAWERQFSENSVDRFYSVIEVEGGFLSAGASHASGASQDDFFKICYMVHDQEGNVIRQWVVDMKDHSGLPSDVSLYKTDRNYYAVVSTSTLDTGSVKAMTVIQQIDIE